MTGKTVSADKRRRSISSGSLKYRFFRPEDLGDIRRLWEESSGWGAPTEEQWNRWYMDGPNGPSLIMVAVDEADTVVGQIVFSPTRVRIGTREVAAVRSSAPILAKHVRFFSPNPLNHPVVRMFVRAREALMWNKVGLIYMVPNPRWMRLLRMLPRLLLSRFPLHSIPLPLGVLPLPEGLSTCPLERWDSRIDQLWHAASRRHQCLVVRNGKSLSWRTGDGDYRVAEIRRDDQLVGVVAARAKGDRQWLISDLLIADDEALTGALVTGVNLALEAAINAPADQPIQKVSVLVTPTIECAAHALGFIPDAYEFPLAIHLLDPSIQPDEVAPEHWFLTAND